MGEIKENTDRSPQTSRNQVEEILRLWDKTFSQMKIFSDDHENVRRFSDQLYSKLKDYLDLHMKLEIGIEEFSFSFEGEALFTDKVISRSLPFLFYKDGMQRLFFFRGLDREEFGNFLDLIRRDASLPAEQSDIVSSFWEQDLANIRYFAPDEYLDTKIGMGMDVQDYTLDKNTLYTGRIELDPEDREALRAAAQAARSDADPEENPEPEPPPDKEGLPITSSILNDSEIERLNGMMEHSRMASPDDELIALLYEILYLEKRIEPFQRTLSVMKQCLDKLLEKGEFLRLSETASSLFDLGDSGVMTGERGSFFQQFLNSLRDESALSGLREAYRNGRIAEPDAFLRYLRLLGPGAIPLMGDMYDAIQAPHRRGEILDVLRAAARERPEKLIDITGNDKPELTCRIIRILGANADPAAVPLLASFFKYGNRDIRMETIRTLGRIGDPSAARILAAFLADPDADIRALAIENMPVSADENVKHRIQATAARKDFRRLEAREKIATLEFMARSSPEEACATLEGFLDAAGSFSRSSALDTAKAAVSVLRTIGSPSAERILEKGTRKGARSLKNACREALAVLRESRGNPSSQSGDSNE